MIITSFITYNSHHCHDKVDDMIQEAVQMEPPTTTEIAIPDPSCTCGKAMTKDMIFPRIVGGVETKVSCTNRSKSSYLVLSYHLSFTLSEKQISMDGSCGS